MTTGNEVARLRAEVRDLTAARDRVLALCDEAEQPPWIPEYHRVQSDDVRAALADPADTDEPREGR